MRSAVYVLWLARRRLARRGSAALLVTVGIAAGAAVVVGIRAGTTVAQDRAVAQAIERIPDGQRSVRAVWFGLPGQSDEPERVLERRARAALGEIVGDPVGLVLLRESTVGGVFAGLGGVERLGRWVELRSGRLPRTCRPQRCEVLRLRGAGRLPRPEGIRLVEVGHAALRSRLLFGDFLAPTDNALARAQLSPQLARAIGYHRPAPPPLFLAEGTEALATAAGLRRVYRSHAWVVPLRPGRPRLWEIDELAAGVADARSELQSTTSSFDVIAPVEELRVAQQAAEVAGDRLRLVGGEAATLLFAFAVLAAAALRRDLAGARRRLSWYGARSWQLALLTLAETLALAAAGTAVGYGVGVAAGAVAATRADAPVAPILRQSVLSWEGVGLTVLVALAATTVLAAAVARAPAPTGRGRFTPLDALALAAVALVALAAWRGDEDETALLLLPGLGAFAAAVLAARALRPVLRLLERSTRRRAPLVRLTALSLARNPGHAAVATAFLVVSFGLALLAEAYRATLTRGESEQAAFAVPRDFLIREDLTRLIPVQDAVPVERFSAFGEADPVLRLGGSVSRLEGNATFTLVGLPTESLIRLHGWRADFGREPREELAARIASTALLRGVRLAADIAIRAAGDHVRLAAAVETPRGDFVRIPLGDVRPGPLRPLRARLPEAARAGKLVGIALEPTTRIQDPGADSGAGREGTLRIDLPADWIGVGGAHREGASFRYTLSPQTETRLRPRQPTDGEPVPVLATPRIAAAAAGGGQLALQVGGEQLPVRVAGLLERFPTVRGEAVVGDVEALATALNSIRPGAARVNEVWLGVAPERAEAVAAQLRKAPFHVLEVESRRSLEAEARRDPIGHGTLLALATAALVALGLALAGIVLTVLADLRDDRGEFFDLEAEGTPPRLLRRLVWLRALAVTAAGLTAGVLAGLALSAVVTDLVQLTARATSPEPPLRLDVDLSVVALALAAYGLAAVVLVGAATRRAFPAGGSPRRVVREAE